LRAVLLAAAVFAAACAGNRGGEVASGARLSAEPSSFDFGTVLPGKVLHRDIVLRNVGGAELTITDVKTTCDCTVVGGYATTLAPGASTSLRVRLTTPAAAGRTDQAIAILSNDPERPRVEIQVTATVVPAPAP
jgi:hypothetical protein